jgi:hypothetical protein
MLGRFAMAHRIERGETEAYPTAAYIRQRAAGAT